MQAIRSKGMKPEMAVRRLVHGMGYRYRLHRQDLPGNPDLVLSRHNKVIFVHGCFWHRHGDPSCKIAHRPKSNKSYWLPKLKRNRKRDRESQAKLKEMGWKVLVLWECQLRNEKWLRRTLKKFLGAKRS